MPFFSPTFLVGGFSPTKINSRKKEGTRSPSSALFPFLGEGSPKSPTNSLSTGGPRQSAHSTSALAGALRHGVPEAHGAHRLVPGALGICFGDGWDVLWLEIGADTPCFMVSMGNRKENQVGSPTTKDGPFSFVHFAKGCLGL